MIGTTIPVAADTSKSMRKKAEWKSDSNVLGNIRTTLEQGIKSTRSNPNVPFFAKVNADILNQLLVQGLHVNFIEVTIEPFKIRLESESDDSLTLSVNQESITLDQTSFETLLGTLIEDVILFSEHYSQELIYDVLQYRLAATQTYKSTQATKPTSSLNTGDHVITPLNAHTGQESSQGAAKDLFIHYDDFSKKEVRLRAAKIIVEFGQSEQISPTRRIRHLLTNSDQYPVEFVNCAAAIVINAHDSYPTNIVEMAAEHILKHHLDLPEKLILQTASAFVAKHRDFFNAPIRDQKDFVAFYKDKDEMSVLENYSKHLERILFASEDTWTFELRGKEDKDKTYVTTETYTLLCMWKSGMFGHVLAVDDNTAIFILKNMSHKAIKLWYSRNNLADS